MTNDPKTTDVCYVKGVGETRAKQLNKLGIKTVSDLVTHYPRGYIDFNNISSIADAPQDEYCVVKARVLNKLSPYYGNIAIYRALVSDGTGEMIIVFFNTKYSFQRLKAGEEYCFYGKAGGNILRREMNSPIFIEADRQKFLMPRYSLTQGISHNMISNYIRNALNAYSFPEHFSEDFLSEYHLMDYNDALKKIHFPASAEEYQHAKRRLAFDELFLLQLGLKSMKNRKKVLTGAKMANKNIKAFYSSLPFELTGAQKRSIRECIKDMQGDAPMSRLLQGDVGSGKTAVAAAACYFAYLNGMQSTLMAPTEILAAQHYDTLRGFLEPLGVKIALLTGSEAPAKKKAVRKAIADGEIHLAIGTQTLIQKNTVFANLGLVIADEQHRFGVEQRAALSAKGENPHTLIMSATPIPRTLGMIIYGDLDISTLDEMPKGRLPVRTYGVDSSYHERLYKFILKYAQNGFQSYIVCPLVEEGISEKASAVNYIEKLQHTCLKDVPTGLLHGKLRASEKDEVMRKFKDGELMLLVSTTVIEVGVDVPNAVVMMIENAEQFGLSQLHQLRGRVGRGSEQAHCVLVTDNKSEFTKARIDTMVRTCDGFEIANEDLKLRGPGDFFGSRQHGLPPLKITDIGSDLELLEETRQAADKVLESDPLLSSPDNTGLKRMVAELFDDCYDA